MKLRYHSLETMGTLDGPGLRTVLFLQGCHMRCLYCHNRDMWDMSGGRESTVEEIVQELKKYRVFYDTSGGGLTLSGGDPLCQAGAVRELFAACREAGIHTALDTSGCLPLNDSVRAVLAETDLVLLDIKQMDAKKHKALTGHDNHLTLDFARYLSRNRVPFWVRYVIVPGWSDSPRDAVALGRFCAGLDNPPDRMDLLAYHPLGEHKWQELGYSYPLKGVNAPDEKTMKNLQDEVRAAGYTTVFLKS
ncbi:MAG: pyruvate formate-lyase-activating protein [Fibrobacterota bacterium]